MNTKEHEYALVALSIERAPLRPLGTALAQMMAATPLGDQGRHTLLSKLYRDSTALDQLRCRAELRDIRAAKRGEREAVI